MTVASQWNLRHGCSSVQEASLLTALRTKLDTVALSHMKTVISIGVFDSGPCCLAFRFITALEDPSWRQLAKISVVSSPFTPKSLSRMRLNVSDQIVGDILLLIVENQVASTGLLWYDYLLTLDREVIPNYSESPRWPSD